MQGRRVYPDSATGHFTFARGDYGKSLDGHWWIRAPRGSMGVIDNHTVVEHEDGTITVSPSILNDAPVPEHYWHGYLERGIWREA